MKDFDIVGALDMYVRRTVVKNFADSVDTFTQDFSEQDDYAAAQIGLQLMTDEIENIYHRHGHAEDLDEFLALVQNDLFTQFKERVKQANINSGKDGVNELPKGGGCS